MSNDELSLKVKNAIEESLELKKLVLQQKLYKILVEMGELVVSSIINGGKVLICGNGGSAADAQHLTAEFLIRLTSEVNREGIPAISLLQDSSTFTAAINDFDPKDLFKRNLQTLAKPEDILLAISTSGDSENIVQVLRTAKEIDVKTLGFLGSDGGDSLQYCDLSFIVPSNKTARVQEVHITAGHALIEYVEAKLLKEGFLKLS
jgi:D-sedoheptulose 7-phosphate isomerase|tara:strand:- start:29 stop:643 length:615 start_codon:yes stop_codon:yes gene_type:complete